MSENQLLDLPVRRIALFTSGVGYHERRGQANGSVRVELPFRVEDVSDALKSLLVLDPASTTPTVSYPAEDTLEATLASLRPDLTGNPGLADLLNTVRGGQVEVATASGPVTGRVLGVEERTGGEATGPQAYLSLYAAGTVQVVPVVDVLGYRLLDGGMAADVERALDLLTANAANRVRHLNVDLPADSSRAVTLAYVTATPVWKATYRLDVTEEPGFLQGWAVVDNTSDVDWRDVELSLFVGRPASFRQDLYSPCRVEREEVPLAIAGSAAVRRIAAGQAEDRVAGRDARALRESAAPAPPMAYAPLEEGEPEPEGPPSLRATSATVETAETTPGGEQFAFTFPRPVTIDRHQSAMLPLAQGDVAARRLSVFSALRLRPLQEANPALAVELTNTLHHALPAGPYTLLADGLYIGDALQDFVPAGAKRLLAYGDDLAVRGSFESHSDDTLTGAQVAKGVLRIHQHRRSVTDYRFVNESDQARRLVVEQPRRRHADLVEPQPTDTTADAWRFELDLPPHSTTPFTVESRERTYDSTGLSHVTDSQLLYECGREMPPRTRQALEQAAAIARRLADAKAAVTALEETGEKLSDEQERLRENITAVGVLTRSGARYRKRLEALESRIEDLLAQHEEAETTATRIKAEFEDFVASLDIVEMVSPA